MTWVRHKLGARALPQSCIECGKVLIEAKVNRDTGAVVSDPLAEGSLVYENEEEGGAIATILSPADSGNAKSCKRE